MKRSFAAANNRSHRREANSAHELEIRLPMNAWERLASRGLPNPPARRRRSQASAFNGVMPRSQSAVALLTSAAAIVIALAIAGCGHKESDGHTHESGAAEPPHETEAGVTFNARKGLLVPPATAKFIGLKVADVEERTIATTLQFSAQVYRAASEARFASLQQESAPTAFASGNVSPADAVKLSEGQTVSAQSATSGVSLAGRIVMLKRDQVKASGHVEVLLTISDAQQSLAAGAFISVSAPLGSEKNVVSVPRSALLRTTEGDFVYTVNGDHFIRAAVKLGGINHEFAEITDGLYAGDQIVVQPVMALWMAELQSIRGGKACADGH
jgi:multidrug efflux pump subunit AcrA (membrane-fusion protein)